MRGSNILCSRMSEMVMLLYTGTFPHPLKNFLHLDLQRSTVRYTLIQPSHTQTSGSEIHQGLCTSQETHDVSATEPNRLMLFGETVAVYCENRTEHINTLCGHFSSYLTGNTLRLRYRAQPVIAVWGNSNIPEDGILHSHRRENLKSYIALTGWAL
jgi:hypothetical protein